MNSTIYRFKIINNKLKNEIINFSNYYTYSNKEELKEKYKLWCDDDNIKQLIQNEEIILKKNNYDLQKNDIYNKIFISIKYYYIKKNLNNNFGNKKIIKKKEIKFSKNLLSLVKRHITNHINNKPSDSLILFLDINKDNINKEIEELNIEKDIFNLKFKKMFKNQYFVINKK